MAGKKLFTADLAAGTDTDMVPAGVPTGKEWSFTTSFCNRTSAPISIRLAISETGTAAASEYYEYDALLPANGVIERTGLVAAAGKHIIARASAAGVSVNGHGYEE